MPFINDYIFVMYFRIIYIIIFASIFSEKNNQYHTCNICTYIVTNECDFYTYMFVKVNIQISVKELINNCMQIINYH